MQVGKWASGQASKFVSVCLIGLLISLVLAGGVLVARQQVLSQAVTVSYTPLSGEAEWEGDWEFSELGADPSESGGERVTIPFTGTDFALRVRRGDYRGYFFASVDGEPANLLPQEERGAYLVLTSPDHAPQVVTIPVASGLDDGPHVAEVIAERGWEQWPLVGWSASRAPDTTAYRWALAGLGALGFLFLAGAVGGARRQGDKETRKQGGKGTIPLLPTPYFLLPASSCRVLLFSLAAAHAGRGAGAGRARFSTARPGTGARRGDGALLSVPARVVRQSLLNDGNLHLALHTFVGSTASGKR